MTFSAAEIQRISGSRLAVYNRKYTETNGNIWIGTIDNRLKKLFVKDVNVGVELDPTDPVVDLRTYLENIQTDITTNTSNITINTTNISLNTAELIRLEEVKADKCFVMAMSIAL